MLSESFCSHLEHAITAALSSLPDKRIRGYWCDGILEAERAEDNLPAHVKHTKQLQVRAWIDEGRRKGSSSSAQRLYRLILHLGEQSYRTYVQKGRLTQFVSAPEHWILVEPAEKTITVQLI